MLPRAYRIVKEKDYAVVMKKGRAYRRLEGQLKAMPNSLLHNRFGVVVSNKVSKKAHDRNLLKRRLRDIIKNSMPGLKPGFDIVFIAYPSIMALEYTDLKKLLEEGFYKLYLR